MAEFPFECSAPCLCSFAFFSTEFPTFQIPANMELSSNQRYSTRCTYYTLFWCQSCFSKDFYWFDLIIISFAELVVLGKSATPKTFLIINKDSINNHESIHHFSRILSFQWIYFIEVLFSDVLAPRKKFFGMCTLDFGNR